jgi:hypothetical protein
MSPSGSNATTQRDLVYLPGEAHSQQNELAEWATPGPSEPAWLLGSTTQRAQQVVLRASLSFVFRPSDGLVAGWP